MFSSRKHLYMWFCVGGITVVIAVIWAASVRYSIGASAAALKESKRKGVETFAELQKNFKKQMEEMKEKFEKLQTTSTGEVSTSTKE